MPRHARMLSSTNIYHVVVKGADRQLIFEEEKDFKKYIEILEIYKEKCEFELYAYCLMSNHVHLLLRTTSMSLEDIFRRINTHYSGWFNAKYNRTGSLQDGRYFSEPVENINYLKNVACYIHFNPTKAGLEPTPGANYPWNSFNEYILGHSKLIDIDLFYRLIGNSDTFFDYHKSSPSEECLDIHLLRKRLPDDVAKDIILTYSKCNNSTEFQNLPIKERNEMILLLHKKGVSVRQLNRLTGTPRGIIERLIAKNKKNISV